MFRQRMEEVQESEQFVTRVWELPVVNDTLSQLSAVYSGFKGHNRLFRLTLETAECGVHAIVSRTVPPVLAKFEKPIETLNSIACQQLDKLEQQYPIITKPSEEVIHETKQICDTAVKPIVDRVSAVKQYGVDKMNNAKQYTTDTVGNVKSYGVDRLNSVADCSKQQVYRVLGTPLCQEVVKNMDNILGVADNLVDHWLPEAEPLKEETCDCEPSIIRTSVGDGSLKEHARVMSRAAGIGSKVRRRMYNKIASQMTNLQLRTKETVERLNFTVDLIEYSRTSMSNAKSKATYVWTEISKTDEQVAKELAEGVEMKEPHLFSNATFERRAIATARHLTQKLNSLLHTVGVPTDQLPVVLQAQMDHARELVHSMTNAIPSTLGKDEGLPKYAIDNLRNYASLLLQTTSSMADWARHIASMTPVIGRFVQASSTPRPGDYELLPESKVELLLQSMSRSSEHPQDSSVDSSHQAVDSQQKENTHDGQDDDEDEDDEDKLE